MNRGIAMEYILTTINCEDIEDDLRIPAFVPVGELMDALNTLYSADGQTLHAEPRGIILDRNKTLEQQGVEHGAKLALS